MLKLLSFTFNPFYENTYVVYDAHTKEAIIIDPGCYTETEQQQLQEQILRHGLKVVGVYCTHTHIDHILGVRFCKETWDLSPQIPEGERWLYDQATEQGAWFGLFIPSLPKPEEGLKEGMRIPLGSSELEVISAPGHTPAHVVFFAPKERYLLSGDVLFKQSIGRTDLPGGSYPQLIQSIKEKVLPLGDDVLVFPGHGPTTTIKEERLYNPFLQ